VKRFRKYFNGICFLVLTLDAWFIAALTQQTKTGLFWGIFSVAVGFACLACGIGWFIAKSRESVEFWAIRGDCDPAFLHLYRNNPTEGSWENKGYVYAVRNLLLPPSVASLKPEDEPVKIRIEVIGRG